MVRISDTIFVGTDIYGSFTRLLDFHTGSKTCVGSIEDSFQQMV